MSEERMNPNFNLESCLRNKVNEAKRYLEDKHKRQKDGACEESSYAESFIYYFQDVETILDLYNKEKEKNEELIERNKALSNNMLSLACNSVRKDKIREYRKQFIKDNKKEKTFMTQSSQINASLIKFCEALLLGEE